MFLPLIFRYVCVLRYKPTNDRLIWPPDQEEKDLGGSKTFSHQYINIANDIDKALKEILIE